MFELQRRISGLLTASIILLYNGCPPNNHDYLCRREEDPDTAPCEQCWTNYLYKLANGEDNC